MSAILSFPWEVLGLIVEACDFHTQLSFSRTCQDFSVSWKRWVRQLASETLRKCDDERLILFSKLTTLNLGWSKNITDQGLATLTSLTTLYLGWNKNITDQGLAPLTSLTTLDLGWNKNITDQGLAPLTSLTTLNLGCRTQYH